MPTRERQLRKQQNDAREGVAMMVVVTLGAGSIILVDAFNNWPTLGSEPWQTPLLFCFLLFWLGMLVLASSDMHQAKGSAWTLFCRPKVLISFLAPLLVPLGFMSFLWLNRRLDPGPATDHQVTLTKLYLQPTRFGGARYYAYFPTWRKASGAEEIKITPQTFYELRPLQGKKIVITTRPGRFGFEWWEAIGKAPQ